MSLLVILFIVGGTMALKDVAYVAAEFLVSRSRALYASACDIVGDISTLLTVGYGGITVVHHGFSLVTLYVCIAIAIGSVLGTFGGLRLGQLINGEKPSVAKLLLPFPLRPSSKSSEPAVPSLTAEERQALLVPDNMTGLTLFDRQRCTDCGGVHLTACPRVKARGPNGTVEYWPWGNWPTENIIWADQVYEEEETVD